MLHKGYICFDPKSITFSDKMFKPFWMIVKLYDSDDLRDYYCSFIKKRYNLKLQRPAFGSHISVIRGESTDEKTWESFKNNYNYKNIFFEYDPSPKTNGKHWWLKIISEELKDMREEMGYPRNGLWGLHLTLGMPVLHQQEHSYYVWENIKKFSYQHS